MRFRPTLIPCLLALLIGCGDDVPEEGGLPTALPFEVERTDKGEPLSATDVQEFTKRVTGFWKDSDFFNWALSISHGSDSSTGKPDYMVWWHDVEAVKTGDLITFRHHEGGGAHNIFIPTPKLLAQASAGYLLTSDPAMGRMVEQYSKGIVAACKGMVWDENDPNLYLMARNIVTQNHSYEIEGGRKKAVDYSAWFNTYENWNAHRIFFPQNPHWGEVWVTNMRSKDDVPHIFAAEPWLRYVAEQGKDQHVRAAAEEAHQYISGFARDIVDSGYHIRTKDAEGKAYVPDEDLASFVTYESIIPNAECPAKLTSALLGYGESRDNDCGLADGNEYEAIATAAHYYNYAIVDTFHLSATLASLMAGAPAEAAAKRLITGLILRLDRYTDPDNEEPGSDHSRWRANRAVLMLRAAAAGVPLTSEEARWIYERYSASLDSYETFSNWNLWDPSVPDGVYDDRSYRPGNDGTQVSIEEMAFFLEYCFSPFKSPGGASVVDCEIVADPARWGR